MDLFDWLKVRPRELNKLLSSAEGEMINDEKIYN